ncbi:LPS export ABC transporter permease LptG [Palleronia caenipelagi]|uniref:LPS export ABC transporter permease LptG n=1 Tax=Palleronia caenipelagi TaxID=2489174 RepID=A0A547Q9E1_9RHOB|nr:LPS export ABC transporter permease LptG [Palleronia caenipelagi]TRD22998.1 LPS export ABC transporter permease LptG [Palleronia caenipelagi]
MIFDFYLARRFAGTLLFVTGIFFGILVLIDLVDQVRRFEGDGVAFLSLLGLTILSVPSTLYAILPLLTIIATLTLFLSLSKTSELVVVRAAGRSGSRALLPPVLVTLVFGIFAVAVLNPMIAATDAAYEAQKETLLGDNRTELSVGNDGLWLRQGNTDGQIVIHAERASADGRVLRNVTFLGFDQSDGPSFRIAADEARLMDGNWVLANAKEWRFDMFNPELRAVRHDRLSVPSDLTAEQILDSFGAPDSISIWALPGFIDDLQQAGFSALRHQVHLQKELSVPLLLVAMVLVGATFTMGHFRGMRTGLMVLSSLTLGFALFFSQNFAQILAESGQIPILLGTWGPPAAAILLPLGLLLHLEDG